MLGSFDLKDRRRYLHRKVFVSRAVGTVLKIRESWFKDIRPLFSLNMAIFKSMLWNGNMEETVTPPVMLLGTNSFITKQASLLWPLVYQSSPLPKVSRNRRYCPVYVSWSERFCYVLQITCWQKMQKCMDCGIPAVFWAESNLLQERKRRHNTYHRNGKHTRWEITQRAFLRAGR